MSDAKNEVAKDEGEVVSVKIADLDREHTQLRVRTDHRAVDDYAEQYKNRKNCAMPPVTVFKDEDGKMYLGDGFHRCQAKESINGKTINAIVLPGTLDDALAHAATCNTQNGVRWTNADKRSAVLEFIERYPEENQRWIAKRCGCSHVFVGKCQKELREELKEIELDAADAEIVDAATTKGGSLETAENSARKVAKKKTPSKSRPVEDDVCDFDVHEYLRELKENVNGVIDGIMHLSDDEHAEYMSSVHKPDREAVAAVLATAAEFVRHGRDGRKAGETVPVDADSGNGCQNTTEAESDAVPSTLEGQFDLTDDDDGSGMSHADLGVAEGEYEEVTE